VDGVPRFQTWPEKLVKSVLSDTYDAVEFSGDVLQGKADPRDPANFKQVMNMTFLAVGLGWKPLKAAYPGITEEQIKALDAYTGSMYQTLNRHLEGRLTYEITPTHAKELDILAKRIDELVQKSPRVEKDLEVFRGINGRSFVARYPNLDPGDIVKFDGFTSTSFREGIAKGFAGDASTGIVFKIQVPKGSPAVHVEDTYRRIGVEGGGFESELLLPRGSQFVVKQLDKDSRVITLEMVPPGKKVKGELVPPKPPKKFVPSYAQDVDQLLTALEKSPSYVKDPNYKAPKGWTEIEGGFEAGHAAKAKISATPTLETLQSQKDALYAKANSLPPGTNKWYDEVEKLDKIDAQIKALKIKNQEKFNKLLNEGNAL
jgi:hypothetical protein